MAAGDTTQGQRFPDDGALSVLMDTPGAYLLRPRRREMWLCLPNGSLSHIWVSEGPDQGQDGVWGFTEHDDGTISVSPSIFLQAGDSAPHASWHGYLERGVFREV